MTGAGARPVTAAGAGSQMLPRVMAHQIAAWSLLLAQTCQFSSGVLTLAASSHSMHLPQPGATLATLQYLAAPSHLKCSAVMHSTSACR